jgi:hypothetical protein
MITRTLTSAEREQALAIAGTLPTASPAWLSTVLGVIVVFLLTFIVGHAIIRSAAGAVAPRIARHQVLASLTLALAFGVIAAVSALRAQMRVMQALRRSQVALQAEVASDTVHEYASSSVTSSWAGSDERPDLVVEFGAAESLRLSAADLEDFGMVDPLSGHCRIVLLPKSQVVLSITHGAEHEAFFPESAAKR